MNTFYFDFADTIAEFQPNIPSVIQRVIFCETGLEIDKKLIQRHYHLSNESFCFSSLRNTNNIEKKYFYIKKNNKILQSIGIQSNDLGQKIFNEIVKSEGHWILKTDLFQTLVEMKTMGNNVSIASNFDVKLRKMLAELGILHLFNKVYISAEIGAEKPDEKFFNIILNENSDPKINNFFIGDNYQIDYIPARRLGFSAILLDEHNLHPEVPNRILCLRELRSFYNGKGYK
jgi:FMN phosphatase YigB (HAD superfamily)